MNTLKNKSVLIIDDDPGMLRALEKVLTRAGLLVSPATWGREGIKEMVGRHDPFDAVISDLRMPQASGLMILHAMRSACPGVPVIIITAYGSPEMTPDWWREQGAAAYLEKPIDSKRLLETLRGVLAPNGAVDHSTRRIYE